jgi:phytoene synthase
MDEHSQAKLNPVTEDDFNQILSNPILDIAARSWDAERYEAFRICYRSMRIIDDLVDNRKTTGEKITSHECTQYSRMITDWVTSLRRKTPQNALQKKLLTVMEKFHIPLWPWEKLVSAMLYDLTHDGFSTFRSFLRYCEGAAVAPASVFMHLCGVTENRGGFTPPVFDIRKAARPLALFSYLVHIIRDFQKDQRNHLNYFADDIRARHGVSIDHLREIARGGDISQPFRDMIAQYVWFAERYRRKARQTIDLLLVHLKSRYQLSLEIIYSLYHQVFERIDPQSSRFTSTELNPTPEEVQKRIARTIAAFQSV